MKMPKDVINKRRKQLNMKMFPSEVWAEKILIREHLTGYRRNMCLDARFFGDFVWRKQRVVLEIDGSSHNGKEAYDKWRDGELKSLGYKVIRVKHGCLKSMQEGVRLLKEAMPGKQEIAIVSKRRAEVHGQITVAKRNGKPLEHLKERAAVLNRELVRLQKVHEVMKRNKLRSRVQGAIGYARTLPRDRADAFLSKKLNEFGLLPEEAKKLIST